MEIVLSGIVKIKENNSFFKKWSNGKRVKPSVSAFNLQNCTNFGVISYNVTLFLSYKHSAFKDSNKCKGTNVLYWIGYSVSASVMLRRSKGIWNFSTKL